MAMTIRFVVCLVAVMAGCEQGAPKPDCAAAAGAIVQVAGAEAPAADVSKVKAALVNRCIEDKWTVEAVSCMRGAKSAEALDACRFKHLTQAQAEKLADAEGGLSSFEPAMAAMTKFKDMMCACKDDTCAKRVSDEMTRWSAEMAKHKQPPKMNEEMQKRATEIGTQMGECMMRAMSVAPMGAP